MENILDDRQIKLLALKKLRESDKWKNIENTLKQKREDYGEIVLQAYGLSDEAGGEDFQEKKKYNSKNKAIWYNTVYKDFIDMLGEGEGEKLLIEAYKEIIARAEMFVKFQNGTNLNTFSAPTDIEYTETDKIGAKCDALKDCYTSLDRKIDELSKEKETVDVPTTEDNSDL